MVFLENEYIKASISAKGAELQQLQNKNTCKEYMWAGDPLYWGKFSPVLFPIVGGLKDNTYYLNDQKYQLPRHGFARDNEFNYTQIDESQVIFNFKSNEDTWKVYPFEFSLSIHYQLIDQNLRCTYMINNPGEDALLFSIGGHPAFATFKEDGLTYGDHYLEFNNDTELRYHKIKNDLVDDETVTLKLENKQLFLAYNLFYEDALVFKNLKSDCISLKNTKTSNGLHFRFSDFPFFGIWAAKNADFICLEPWCGIADSINHNSDFSTKEGVIELAPSSEWQRHWEIETF